MNEEKIKRYEVAMESSLLGHALSYWEDSMGEWCKSSDVTALESELTRLREEKQGFENAANYWKDQYDRCNGKYQKTLEESEKMREEIAKNVIDKITNDLNGAIVSIPVAPMLIGGHVEYVPYLAIPSVNKVLNNAKNISSHPSKEKPHDNC